MLIFDTREPLFDVDAGGGSAPAPVAAELSHATDVPPQTPQMSIGDFWDRDNQPASAEPPAQQLAPEVDTPVQQEAPPASEPEKIMGKYNDVGEIVKAHQALQTTYNREHMTLLELNRVVDQLKADKAALEEKMNSPQAPQQPTQQPKDEFEGLDKEAIIEKLYEDPMGFLKRAEENAYVRAEKAFSEKFAQLEAKVNPTVAAVEAQKNQEMWDSAVLDFAKNNPDVSEFKEGMAKYLQENNLGNSKEPAKVLSDAYIYARGLKYQPPQTVDVKTLLRDEKFVSENILNNPTVREQFVKAYLAEVRGSQQGIPPTITGNSNMNSVAPPQPKARDIKEATRMAADRIWPAR
jgi:hypothetical protein